MTPCQPRRFFGLYVALAVFGAVLLTSCIDSVISTDDAISERSALEAGPTFRHEHLLDRAIKPIPGKSGSAQVLGLIVGFQSGVEKQRVTERYKVAGRYKVSNRYSYDHVFHGLAWMIDDTYGSADFQDFLDSLAQDPDVLWFEPSFGVVLPPSNRADGTIGQQVPWSVAAIGGQTSWAVSGDGHGSVNVDLYLLDTGVANANASDPHDDLALVESLDFRDSTLMLDPADHDGHGTHIAGIAAAVDDNDGLVGVAPGARIHNYKVLNDDGIGDVATVIAAIEHVMAEKEAHPSTPMVVNLSLGEDVGTSEYTALDEAVVAATGAGVVFVVAAGNHGKDASEITPAHVGEVITVGAYDVTGSFAWFSNYGQIVDLLAPGEAVVSLGIPPSGWLATLVSRNKAVMMSGTSMATAHVSGAAALYLGRNPTATPAQVRQALVDAAEAFVVGTPKGTTNKSVWVGEESMVTDDHPDDATVTVLFVVPDAGALTAQDATKKALMQSWSFTVELISAADSKTAFDAAAAAADVAYISEEISASQLNIKLKDATIGIVNEEKVLTDEYGFSASSARFTAAAIVLNDNTHYCTAPFDTGPLAILSAPSALHTARGRKAGGAQVLAGQPASNRAALIVIDAGASLFGGGTAAGRRVHLPWGNNTFDIHLLNANGELLMRRALEWAAGLDA